MRYSIVFALALSAPLLAACSYIDGSKDEAAQRSEATKVRLDRMMQDINGCGARRVAGEATPRVAYAQCVNHAFQTAMADIDYGSPDIVASLSAERLRVAEQADKGEISDAEGQARLADKISEVVRLERARLAGKKDADRTPSQYFLELLQVGL